MNYKLVCYFTALLCALSGWSASHAASLHQTFQLPPLERIPPEHPLYTQLHNSQAMRKLAQTDVQFTQLEDPDRFSEQLAATILAELSPAQPPIGAEASDPALAWFTGTSVLFQGTTAKELQMVINVTPINARIVVQTSHLALESPVRLREGQAVVGLNSEITGPSDAPAFIADGIRQFSLSGLRIHGADVAVWVRNSGHFLLQRIELQDNRRGIVIQGNSQYGLVEHIHAHGHADSALTLAGPVQHILVRYSRFDHGTDYFNWHAGAVLTDTPWEDDWHDETAFQAQAVRTGVLANAPTAPHHNLFTHNSFSMNRASGLYVDGGVANVIRANEFHGNDKEGVCLDGGALFNIVMDNTVTGNGFRLKQADDELAADFVLALGRGPDGGSVAKLPGISMDNAALNQLVANRIQGNAGDGIKMVRAAFRNLILFNSILDNNLGSNSKFHFFGVLIGYAKLDHADEQNLYDAFPSSENIIAGNTIYGAHHSAVLLDHGAAFNDIYNNVLYKFRFQPVESASREFNSIVDNASPRAAEKPRWLWEHRIELLLALLILLQAGMILFRFFFHPTLNASVAGHV